MPHLYPPPGQPSWGPYAGKAPSAWGSPPPTWPAGPGWGSPPPAWSGSPGWGSPPPTWPAGPGWGSPPAWSGGPGWGSPPPAWQASEPYSSAGWSYAPEPVVVEWAAILEPALDAVLPAIQGLIEISSQLLSGLPGAIDIPAASSGMGHLGLFGAAEADGPQTGDDRAEA